MPDPTTIPSITAQGLPVRIIDPRELGPEGSSSLNPGLTRHRGTLLMAYRHRHAVGAAPTTRLGQMRDAASFDVTKELLSGTPELWSEDPRLLTHDGELYCSYIQVRPPPPPEPTDFEFMRTETDEAKRLAFIGQRMTEFLAKSSFQQRFARLGADLEVEARWVPRFGKNEAWQEKNWQFFSTPAGIAFVYSIVPFVVARLDLADGGAAEVSRDERRVFELDPLQVSTGPVLTRSAPRGCSPAVRWGDEYVALYHTHVLDPWCVRRYAMGAYTFSAAPPYRILRRSREPLLRASDHDPLAPDDPWKMRVVFPAGLVRVDAGWLVSVGVNDCRCALVELSDEALDANLIDVSGR
jgi:predicted GH43/DUF377 family glycosyl hydrolase